MCGTGTVGSGASTQLATMANNTMVAGASGGGDTAAATGGSSSIAALLQQIATSIQSLQQLLAGSGALSGAVAGATGGGGMEGCDMMGGGHAAADGAVAGANDGADAIGDATGGGAPAKTDVAGDTGAGKDDPIQSNVGGEAGGSVTQAGGPTQDAAAIAAQKSTDAAAAATAADAKVATAKSDVTKAEAALTKAQQGKVAADTALVDAGAALTAARTGNGEHVANGSETIAQVARRYGVTTAKLQELNPSITVLGSLPQGTKLTLPKGVGVAGKVAAAQLKLDQARAAAGAADKAVQDAIAALNAAREALRQAEAAAAAAKQAAEDAARAAADAKKAADEAAATAATTAGGGVGGETAPTTRDYVVKPGDSPYKIAQRENVDALAFAKLNAEAFKSGVIRPGQVLKIPVGAGPFNAGTAKAAFDQYWPANTGRANPQRQPGSNTGSNRGGSTTPTTTTTAPTTTTTPAGPKNGDTRAAGAGIADPDGDGVYHRFKQRTETYQDGRWVVTSASGRTGQAGIA